jgi:hypothetical protein
MKTTLKGKQSIDVDYLPFENDGIDSIHANICWDLEQTEYDNMVELSPRIKNIEFSIGYYLIREVKGDIFKSILLDPELLTYHYSHSETLEDERFVIENKVMAKDNTIVISDIEIDFSTKTITIK